MQEDERYIGEYIIYYRGKVVGGIYDDWFLVKNIKTAADLMPEAALELPYDGAKEMLLRVDDIENKELPGHYRYNTLKDIR